METSLNIHSNDGSLFVTGTERATRILQQKLLAYEALKLAAMRFVAKVDEGRARSLESYGEFKDALALAKPDERGA